MLKQVECSYGKRLVQKYHDYQNADAEVSELVLRVENCWLKTEAQIEFLEEIRDILGERLRAHQNKLLEVLQIKLVQSSLHLDRITPRQDHGSDIN